MKVQPAGQHGVAVWMILLVLVGLSGLFMQQWAASAPRQRDLHITMAALATAQQALLAYAQQTLTAGACGMNCPRPGDLPCPDRNNDGIAESSCSTTARLGRLPWKTLGVGDLRDASGERLWYAVAESYKNNPRRLPLNSETPGSWSVMTAHGQQWNATQGQGVVAVVIAPMHALTRQDGWVQQRSEESAESIRHYLDLHSLGDHALAAEYTAQGFIMATASAHFNDVVWPITATTLHRHMQQQVLAELKRSLRCQALPCPAYPHPAALTDQGCLGYATLVAGQCVADVAGLGRLPVVTAEQWPAAAATLLDGDARHHWFQQNGWREQVFYQRQGTQLDIVMSGEALPGQLRVSEADKSTVASYLEVGALQTLQVTAPAALAVAGNDTLERIVLP